MMKPAASADYSQDLERRLRMFCSRASHLKSLSKPFSYNGFIYATTGHIVLRVAAGDLGIKLVNTNIARPDQVEDMLPWPGSRNGTGNWTWRVAVNPHQLTRIRIRPEDVCPDCQDVPADECRCYGTGLEPMSEYFKLRDNLILDFMYFLLLGKAWPERTIIFSGRDDQSGFNPVYIQLVSPATAPVDGFLMPVSPYGGEYIVNPDFSKPFVIGPTALELATSVPAGPPSGRNRANAYFRQPH